MDKPLISLCMPAYNAGASILRSVGSLIEQSYQNWELIIINDGSTDNTARQLASLSDNRIQVYHQENKGQCAACNKAFSLSKGTLIKFMDADDLLSENYLEMQERTLRGTVDEIAYGPWARFYDDGTVDKVKPDPSQVTGDMAPFDWLLASMTGKEVMLQCALWLIPRNILLEAGPWNEQLSLINDFEFFIRVLLHARKLKYAGDILLYYRSGLGQSLSSGKSAAAAASAYQSIEQGTSHLLNFSNTPEVRRIAADCFQRFVYSFYPDQQQLVKQAARKVKGLGGSGVAFPAGGYTKIICRILGWKATKKIKSIFQIH